MNNIVRMLQRYKIRTDNEFEVQQQVEQIFKSNGVDYKREFRLSPKDRIDFLVDSIGIEIKVHGWSAKKIYDQIERYSKYDLIRLIVLLTSQACHFPNKINEKQIVIINLGRSWL